MKVLSISRGLSFARKRFAEEHPTETFLSSDRRDDALGRNWSLFIEETGFLVRGVWLVGADGKVKYRDTVTDKTLEPDYAVLEVAVVESGIPAELLVSALQ